MWHCYSSGSTACDLCYTQGPPGSGRYIALQDHIGPEPVSNIMLGPTDMCVHTGSWPSIMWSDYRKSLLGDLIRICLKIEQNCRLFLDIFNSTIMNDLFMTFTSRLKVDAKCVY